MRLTYHWKAKADPDNPLRVLVHAIVYLLKQPRPHDFNTCDAIALLRLCLFYCVQRAVATPDLANIAVIEPSEYLLRKRNKSRAKGAE